MTAPDPIPSAPGGSIPFAGRRVARIGFGAMQLGERRGRPTPDRETALAVLRKAVAGGVNHIDTAEFYGPGTANQLIRAALAPYSDDLALVSKVGADHDPAAGLVTAQRPEQLRASVEANLTTLGVDSLAVVNLRRADSPPGIVAQGDQIVDLDSQLAELIALRDEGKIGGIGLSAVTAEDVRAALPAGIVCVQNGYNLLERTHEPVLDVCRANGIAWVPFFPLGSGFPGLPKVTENETVLDIANTLGVSASRVGLAWLLAHYENTLLIPGTADPDHLDDNLAAGRVVLDPEALRRLDAVA